MGTRYTAVIKIVRVDEIAASTYRTESKPATKSETELASIIVRNAELGSLLTKTKAHLDLVEDTK